MVAYEIRAALPGDEEQLLHCARHLDSVNLPDDRAAIDEIVDASHRSFNGDIADPHRRQYVFVLVDRAKDLIVGTSMIFAQLGRRGAPYIFFDVLDEEKYSATIERHFHHTVLRIGYSYNGPTEIGGLVLMPAYRLAAERLGTMISYVRFLYLASHRSLFRETVLAELLPPLEPDGTSHLWEAVGRHFTGMSYAEADKLSKKNKEFIKALFPEGVIYASVLPKPAQAVLGKVGASTRGVEKLLRRIGFRYAARVDPFDGGPHFTAHMDEISLVTQTRMTVASRPLAYVSAPHDKRALVAVELRGPPYFRAVMAHVHDEGSGAAEPESGAGGLGRAAPHRTGPAGIAVEGAAWDLLGLTLGTPITVLPID